VKSHEEEKVRSCLASSSLALYLGHHIVRRRVAEMEPPVLQRFDQVGRPWGVGAFHLQAVAREMATLYTHVNGEVVRCAKLDEPERGLRVHLDNYPITLGRKKCPSLSGRTAS
jgi:hypothetical protein